LNTALIEFFQTVSLPEYDTDIILNLLKDYEIDGYFKLTNKELSHKLLGYPNPITQHLPLKENDILLLQLDCDETTDSQWKNMSRIYICIDKDKLRRLQFDNLSVYIQSYKEEEE
jgi:uncharacterized protein YwqG